MELPEDSVYYTIMMAMDRFSKMIVLVPLQSTDMEATANAFFHHDISQYGLPRMIMRNQDLQFITKFWQEFMKVHITAL